MFWVFFLFFCGILLVYFGMTCRLGKYRSWYFVSDSRRSSIPYLGVPFGIGIIFAGLSLLLPAEELRLAGFLIGTVGGLFVGLIFLLFQPSFMKPEWLKWLEDQQKPGGNLMLFVRQEFDAIGEREWERRTATQEGLEEWIAEVRSKYEAVRFVPNRQGRK